MIDKDLEEASNKYAEDHTGLCLENDGGLYEDFDKPKRDFIAGANWRKQQIINKSCEWLQKHMNDYIVHGRDIDFLYDDFREAMEEE